MWFETCADSVCCGDLGDHPSALNQAVNREERGLGCELEDVLTVAGFRGVERLKLDAKLIEGEKDLA